MEYMERFIAYLHTLSPEKKKNISWIVPAVFGGVLFAIFLFPFLFANPIGNESASDGTDALRPLESIGESIGVAWKNISNTLSKISE